MTTKFAIRNGIKTAHHVIAICQIWTYDVVGNARDGFEVNDRSCQDRAYELPATLYISNVPQFPGAKDEFCTFPNDSSFEANITLSFELDSRTLHKVFGVYDNGQGDGTTYYFDAKNGRPLGEINIISWKQA